MTLDGVTAAIGRVIDDAIVVVEAIIVGQPPRAAAGLALCKVGSALVGSTLTPVVASVPLAFLDGAAGETAKPRMRWNRAARAYADLLSAVGATSLVGSIDAGSPPGSAPLK